MVMKRRLGYYVLGEGGAIDSMLLKEELTPESQEELNRLVQVVLELQPIQIAYEVLEGNYQDLERTIGLMASERPADNMGPLMIEEALEGLYTATQRVVNILATFNSFLVLTQDVLKRIDPNAAAEFEGARNKLHTESFAYRFLYLLRNFSQHSGLPIGGTQLHLSREKSAEPFRQRSSIYILRDKLLGTSFDWKSSRKTLEEQAQKFDVLPLLVEQRSIANRLFSVAIATQAIPLAECSRYIDVLLALIRLPSGAVPVVFIGDSLDPKFPPKGWELVPVQQLRSLAEAHRRALSLADPQSLGNPGRSQSEVQHPPASMRG